MQLNKCPKCSKYTLKQTCPKCKTETESAHYKFKKIKDAPKDSAQYFDKLRKHIPKQERIKLKENI